MFAQTASVPAFHPLFSRVYPKITLSAYIEVKVKLVFRFSNPEATWEKEYLAL